MQTETRYAQVKLTNAGFVVSSQNKFFRTNGTRHARHVAFATVLDANNIAVHGSSSCTPLGITSNNYNKIRLNRIVLIVGLTGLENNVSTIENDVKLLSTCIRT
jgi:hypothetical protein